MSGEKCNVCGLLIAACQCGVEPPVCGRCSGRGLVSFEGSGYIRMPCPRCRPQQAKAVTCGPA
jgi:hypothetical protein